MFGDTKAFSRFAAEDVRRARAFDREQPGHVPATPTILTSTVKDILAVVELRARGVER